MLAETEDKIKQELKKEKYFKGNPSEENMKALIDAISNAAKEYTECVEDKEERDKKGRDKKGAKSYTPNAQADDIGKILENLSGLIKTLNNTDYLLRKEIDKSPSNIKFEETKTQLRKLRECIEILEEDKPKKGRGGQKKLILQDWVRKMANIFDKYIDSKVVDEEKHKGNSLFQIFLRTCRPKDIHDDKCLHPNNIIRYLGTKSEKKSWQS